jgi:hypothetical protein
VTSTHLLSHSGLGRGFETHHRYAVMYTVAKLSYAMLCRCDDSETPLPPRPTV